MRRIIGNSSISRLLINRIGNYPSTRDATQLLQLHRGGTGRTSNRFNETRITRTTSSSSSSPSPSSNTTTTKPPTAGTRRSGPPKNSKEDSPKRNEENEAPRWMQKMAPTKGGLDPPNKKEAVAIAVVALVGGYAWFVDEGSMIVKWKTNDGKNV